MPPPYNPRPARPGSRSCFPASHAIPANWSDPRVQIAWGLAYIQDRYGSPCAAWAFERSHVPNWY